MPTSKTAQGPNAVSVPELLPLRDITEMLVKKFDYHEGYYDLSVEFQMGIGGFGPSPTEAVPTVIAGVTRIGLVKTASPVGKAVVDASLVNPLPEQKARPKAKPRRGSDPT